MECREIRDRLPLLHLRNGLPAGEAEAVETHLASCPECRAEDRALRDDLRSLRAAHADLGAEPPTNEEVTEMLADLQMESRRSRVLPLAAAAAVLLVVAGAAVFLLTRVGDRALFAEGPQVADAEGVRVQPPLLRIPRGKAWDREKHRVLVTIRDGVFTMRLSYEPEDGKGPVRELDRNKFATPPAPEGGGDRPALLLAADPETPWSEVRLAMRMFEPIKVYIAGREPDGSFGALPFFAAKGVEEIVRMGAAVAPNDMARGAQEGGALEVRITRTGRGTRYRIGLWPFLDPATERFEIGDEATLDPDQLVGDGPAVPHSLRARIEALGRKPRGPRGVAFLQVGRGVRYVDVLRAVECAGGAESFCFVQHPEAREMGDFVLPEPLSPADARYLEEDVPKAIRTIVKVDKEGKAWIRGIMSGLEAIDSAAGDEILLRADARAPWPACARVLARAHAAGKRVGIAFAPEDPMIAWERVLDLPAPADLRNLSGTRLEPGSEVLLTVAKPGMPPDPLAVTATEGATVGEIAPLLLSLARMGVPGFAFE